jgi:hypothetical protein
VGQPPASHKMMEPRYREVKSHQVRRSLRNGVGSGCLRWWANAGARRDIVTDPHISMLRFREYEFGMRRVSAKKNPFTTKSGVNYFDIDSLLLGQRLWFCSVTNR